jgi:hypothetical protein
MTDFDTNGSESVDCFYSTVIFAMLIMPIHEHGSFSLFWCLLQFPVFIAEILL